MNRTILGVDTPLQLTRIFVTVVGINQRPPHSGKHVKQADLLGWPPYAETTAAPPDRLDQSGLAEYREQLRRVLERNALLFSYVCYR